MLIMRLVEDTVSMVRPQKCIKPATLTKVKRTQATTCKQPNQLESSIKVVMEMQMRAKPKFR